MEFLSRLWTPLLALQILVAQGVIVPAIAADSSTSPDLDSTTEEVTAEKTADEAVPAEEAIPEVSEVETAPVETAPDNAVILPDADTPVEVPPADAATPKTDADVIPADLTPADVTPADVTPADLTPIEAATPEEAELELDLPDAEAPAESGTETDAVSDDLLNESDETTERIFLIEEQISFVPPSGFTPMTVEEIRLKFPGTMPPQFAYANEPRNVSIGISLSDIDLAPEQLPEVRQFLEGFLEGAVPGFEWVSRDYETLGGTRWIKLEFISQALDTQVHNDLYITSFNGKLLGFNFNSVLSLEKDLRPQLKRSRDSILLAPVETAKNQV